MPTKRFHVWSYAKPGFRVAKEGSFAGPAWRRVNELAVGEVIPSPGKPNPYQSAGIKKIRRVA